MDGKGPGSDNEYQHSTQTQTALPTEVFVADAVLRERKGKERKEILVPDDLASQHP